MVCWHPRVIDPRRGGRVKPGHDMVHVGTWTSRKYAEGRDLQVNLGIDPFQRDSWRYL